MTRRSVLFSPGNRPEMLRTAADSAADVLVFDLEDAVAPDRKDAARETVTDVLSDPEFDPACEVFVRVNELPDGKDDLATVLSEDTRLDGLVLPKVNEAEEVNAFVSAMRAHGSELPVFALVETAAGVLHAESIAAVDATDALVFGAEDLTADIGATRSRSGDEIMYARQHVVLAARTAGVDAIDTLCTAVDDTERVYADAEHGVTLGYDGKLAIHPAQIDPIHEAFVPGDDEIEWARRVLAASEHHDGVFKVDGEMIDQPLIRRAERIKDRAGRQFHEH
ncbi:HpcH/HpaI aldolase/citrate lyase family protein [Natranaeroarchaeum aerophilus]|uniref:CoA ester lyase n=1 Tax=Natranaeroarchaeum aerophilus TaxID=2917711 RepID=A0AAE3FTV8_9EURY|nr:CoA ester lyase [Natranaeroarchaeum aerophilus]MCL9815101.1 CoA ester lyase [Natranaeroarchaeum aerophilus]